MDTLFNVIAPVFGIVLTGFLAGTTRVLGPESALALNRFVYFFALPAVLFVFTARAPIDKVLNWPFIGAVLGGTILTLLLSVIVGRLWFRHGVAELTMQGMCAVFANTAYMGIPLLSAVFGADGVLPSIVATLSANTLLIAVATAAIESSRATGGHSPARVVAHVAQMVVKSPLIIAPFLGIVFSYFSIPLPKSAAIYLDMLAAAASPGALFGMGLSLVGRELRGDLGEAFWLVFVKLVVHPAATLLLVATVFPMDRLWGEAAVLLAALPAGATVFVIAQQYGTFVQRASTVIVLSTGLSIATISALLIWYRG